MLLADNGHPPVLDRFHTVDGVDLSATWDQGVPLIEGPRGEVVRKRVQAKPVRHQLLRPSEQLTADTLALAARINEDLRQLAGRHVGSGEADDGAFVVGDNDLLLERDVAGPPRAPGGERLRMAQSTPNGMPRIPPQRHNGVLVLDPITSHHNQAPAR